MNRPEGKNRDPRRGLPYPEERSKTNTLVGSAPKNEPNQRDAPRYHKAENVLLMQSAIHRGKSISCKIVQLMPFNDAGYQYRIKCDGESFERIASEHDLRPGSRLFTP